MNPIKLIKLLSAYHKFEESVEKDPMKWLPSVITLCVTAVGLFQPDLQSYVGTHPQVAVAVGGIYAIVKGLLPSPVSSKSSN